MTWWTWMLLGLALLALEMLTPGAFHVFFFGAGALLVGALVSGGLAGEGAVQGLRLSVVSLASLLVFRRRRLDRFNTPSARRGDIDMLHDEVAVASSDLPPGA